MYIFATIVYLCSVYCSLILKLLLQPLICFTICHFETLLTAKIGEYECWFIAQYFEHEQKTRPVLFSKTLETHATHNTDTISN